MKPCIGSCIAHTLGRTAGVNHAQFGDDKLNAARGDIKATVSFEQAQHLIAQVSKGKCFFPCPWIAQ